MFEKFGRAEKLLMRIRSVKWQASTIASTAEDAAARDAATALVADLTAAEASARSATADDTLAVAEQHVDALALRLSAFSQPR